MPALPAEQIDDLWDYDRPAESEARFREVLAREDLPSPSRAEVLTQVARALGLQGKFDDAHAVLDGVETALPEAGPRVQARYLLERGRALNSSGRRDDSRPFFRQALALASEAGEDFYAIDAAHMLGIVEPPDRALDWNLTAEAMAKGSTADRARRWLASLHNNLGWAYHDRGEYQTALRYFEEALAERRARGDARETGIARWCVARALRSLGRCEEALTIQRELLADGERRGASDGAVDEEMAECLAALGRIQEARPYARRAHAFLMAQASPGREQSERLQRMEALSRGG